MRPARPVLLTALVLILSAATGDPARAQSSPGWVDPPARGGTPAAPPAPAKAETPQDGAKAAARDEPARAAARSPAAETPAPGTAQAVRQAAPVKRAERSRHAIRDRAARRLAEVPPPAPTLPQQAQPQAQAPAPRSGDWAGSARGLVADYFGAVSAPGERMAATAPHFYAETVRFHGRTMTLSALMAEKRRFARRWPQRSYEARGMSTTCNGALARCVVRAEVDFRAASPGRGAVSRGVAEVVMEVSYADGRPVIVSETSRVLSRGALSAAAPARPNA